jgi:hypothetical protein
MRFQYLAQYYSRFFFRQDGLVTENCQLKTLTGLSNPERAGVQEIVSHRKPLEDLLLEERVSVLLALR